jgi:hypothetical protein
VSNDTNIQKKKKSQRGDKGGQWRVVRFKFRFKFRSRFRFKCRFRVRFRVRVRVRVGEWPSSLPGQALEIYHSGIGWNGGEKVK